MELLTYWKNAAEDQNWFCTHNHGQTTKLTDVDIQFWSDEYVVLMYVPIPHLYGTARSHEVKFAKYKYLCALH